MSCGVGEASGAIVSLASLVALTAGGVGVASMLAVRDGLGVALGSAVGVALGSRAVPCPVLLLVCTA